MSEDAPTDAKAALDQSDLVIVGKIVEVRPGRRFYGVDPDDPNGVGTEDVTLVLAPERVIKGDEPGPVEFGWPAFATKDGQRVARLEVSHVLIDEPSEALAVWFLKDYGQPFGLVPISLGTAMMSVNGKGIISGQRSEGFDRYAGLTVDELIDEANG
jgi:hypothetical protein